MILNKYIRVFVKNKLHLSPMVLFLCKYDYKNNDAL